MITPLLVLACVLSVPVGEAPAPAAAAPAAVGPLSAAAAATARVLVETDLGELELEVELARAPVTARNFLRYVEAGRYDGGRFHRTVTPENQPASPVKIAVIQGGEAPAREAGDFPPIPLERTRDTGLRHLDGTLSMARAGPDTATSDFFICVGPQPALDFGGRRNPDGQGFAAFGRVVRGLPVVQRIWRSPSQSGAQALAPPVVIRRVRVLPSAASPVRSSR
jgi:peptidyl-prolyl cis-trans isomerase A (cyclophilin A)